MNYSSNLRGGNAVDNQGANGANDDLFNDYIEAEEAAKIFRTTVETLRRYRKKGLITGVMRFKRRWYSRTELRRLFPTVS